jgi:hypothetical protein
MGEARPTLRQAPVTAEVAARRFRLASPAAAIVLGTVVLAEMVATLVLMGLDHQLHWFVAGPGVILLIFTGVAVLVTYHQPRNPVGWILLQFCLLFMLAVAAEYYAALYYHLGYHGLPLASAAVIGPQLAAGIAFTVLPLAILLFPDGRLAWPRWRWVLRAYAVVSVYFLVASIAPAVAAVASHDVHVDSSGTLTDTGQLTGWLVHQPGWLTAAVNVALGVIWLLFVGHQVVSWRHAAGERRQQLKWLAFGAAIALGVGVLVSSLTSGVVSDIFSSALLALPISIGVAILKYRLYDIERIISRTVAYAVLTGMLVGVYAGLVLLATEVLAIRSPVAVAASTLAAAALFSPLRRRVQRVVDRRFNRARYDAELTVAVFAARLQDATDPDAVRADLTRTVQRALEPASLSVWLAGPAR